MNVEISPLGIFDILSISFSFMLGLLFLTSKSKNNKANKYLGMFLWILSADVLDSFLSGQDIDLGVFAVGLLTLPLLFLYIIKTLNYNLKLWYLLLTIPFLSELVVSTSAFFHYGFSVILLLYILKILQNHKEKVGDYYSETDNKTLSWMKSIVYIYLFFFAFWITEDLVGLEFEAVTYYFAITSTVLTLVMIYWIGYNGFSQPDIFDSSILVVSEQETLKEEAGKQIERIETERSEISNIEKNSNSDFELLTHHIKAKKLFLSKEITIRNLSHQLEINEKEFSKLIKTHTEKNFYHYINQFRVDEFKRLLQTDKANHLSLLGLSEEAGFSSKSTFYNVFKLSEGVTPKQFQDQLKKSE